MEQFSQIVFILWSIESVSMKQSEAPGEVLPTNVNIQKIIFHLLICFTVDPEEEKDRIIIVFNWCRGNIRVKFIRKDA